MGKKAAAGLFLLWAVLLVASAHAHAGDDGDEMRGSDEMGGSDEMPAFLGSDGLEHRLRESSAKVLFVASIISALFLYTALLAPKAPDSSKAILFAGVAVPVVAATIYLAGGTLYLNLVSETKGPVHWHADFEVWKCGERLDLVAPTGISNRVGTEVLHEHGDSRMHVEGVPVQKSDVSLHHFFETTGGSLTGDSFSFPTDMGMVRASNGERCPDGMPGMLQGFVYKTVDGAVVQEKLSRVEDYVLSPYSQVPPGDCIILEFDSTEKEMTERVCETYRSRMGGESHGG